MIGNPAQSGGVFYFTQFDHYREYMQIENHFLEATIDPKGAELHSLILKSRQHEYIWEADSTHWGRHAPVLFPFVGKVKGGVYEFQGKTYPMDKHGFARDAVFEEITRTDSSVTFRLESGEENRAKYPFSFQLDISYRLEDQSLVNEYIVRNVGTGVMPFSIGAHPAFKCPQDPSEKRSEYRLVFNREEDIDTHLLNEEGFFNGETRKALKGNSLPISDELFDDDALVFKSLNSTNVVLESGDNRWLKFHYQGFPYLGIWSMSRESPFVCIEPWFGLADHANHDGDIEKKEGVRFINPGESFVCDYRVEVF